MQSGLVNILIPWPASLASFIPQRHPAWQSGEPIFFENGDQEVYWGFLAKRGAGSEVQVRAYRLVPNQSTRS